jgi:hypothetical protein
MPTISLTLFDGHPIIHDGNSIILIDTGAPSTIHTANALNFCGQEYNCTTNFLGLTISTITQMLGMEITTLLGADILSDFVVLFDYANKTVTFERETIDFEGNEIQFTTFQSIPRVQLSVGENTYSFFLDTGAKLSYLASNVTDGHETTGKLQDFYPGFGVFETDCFAIPTRIGDTTFQVNYGNLPALLQMTLMMGSVDGIIGYDFFANFQVYIDFQNQRLKYRLSN